MSNYLSVATVTATLQNVLSAAAAVVPGASVTTQRPDSTPGTNRPAGINIYLFQVTPNASFRNADLPTRTGNGTVMQRPQAALDLHYLLSFYGDESQFQPQRLLGSTVRVLHGQPLLPRQRISETAANPPFTTFPDRSDLANQVELVRFTPMALSLEELSKIWSVFFQTPFALSIAYQGSLVLIEGTETPQTGPPVRERNVYAIPFQHPEIEQIVSSAGDREPIVAGSTLVVRGSQLTGEVTFVLLGGVDRAPLSANPMEIRLAIPSDIAAGVQGLQVVHRFMMGSPPTAHRGVQSNVASFVYRPTITGVTGSSTSVGLTMTPIVRRGQRLTLLLNEMPATGSGSYSFSVPPAAADNANPVIPIANVKAASYLVRVQVDGAESPLTVSASGEYTGPTVAIP